MIIIISGSRSITAGRLVAWAGVGGAAVQRQDGGTVVVAAVCLAQLVAQHVAQPGRGVAEELRQGAHRLALGVDPEAVLVLEDLEVELLDDVVGLGQRLQACVAAVQQAPGVAQQAVAGEFQQPLAGGDVAANGPLQKPCRTVVDSSLTGHAPFTADEKCCASVYSSRGQYSGKNPVWRYPSGRLPPG